MSTSPTRTSSRCRSRWSSSSSLAKKALVRRLSLCAPAIECGRADLGCDRRRRPHPRRRPGFDVGHRVPAARHSGTGRVTSQDFPTRDAGRHPRAAQPRRHHPRRPDPARLDSLLLRRDRSPSQSDRHDPRALDPGCSSCPRRVRHALAQAPQGRQAAARPGGADWVGGCERRDRCGGSDGRRTVGSRSRESAAARRGELHFSSASCPPRRQTERCRRSQDSRSVRAVASSLGYLAGDESAKPPPMCASWFSALARTRC